MHDRAYMLPTDRPVHVLEEVSGAHCHAAHGDTSHENWWQGQPFDVRAGYRPDHGDGAASTHGAQRLVEGRRASEFDDDVGSVVAQSARGAAPIGVVTVVDDVVGAHRCGP